MVLFSISAVHAFSFADGLKVDATVKKLSFTGYTKLNDITVTQDANWDEGDVLEVNFDLCKIDVGPAGSIDCFDAKDNGTPDVIVANFYKLPYVVNWWYATSDNIDAFDFEPVRMFYRGGSIEGMCNNEGIARKWAGPLGFGTIHAGPPLPQAGDYARAYITANSERSKLVIKSIYIVQNMFPWWGGTWSRYPVRASFYPENDPPTLPLESNSADLPDRDPNFFCNPGYWHEGGILLATYGEPCATFLKYGLVVGVPDLWTLLVVSSDMSTTCKDGKEDIVEFHAWDDLGTYVGKADGTFTLVNPADPAKSNAQAYVVVGDPTQTWGGGAPWASASGLGQVIAFAAQPYAHGVAVFLGGQGIQGSYLALSDPSITSVDSSGIIKREDWYNFAEPYMGYLH